MEQINLNLIPNGVNPVAHCKQYDVGRTFRCNLFEGTSVYTLDGTETVEVEVHKPDGNLVTLALTNTGSTYVDVTTTLQMCACSGESLAAIKITSGGVELGSLNFVLYCERSPLEGGITSDSGIYNLETQVSSLVASEVADQYDSANVIFDSEPTAGHGNGYAVTSEGIVDYVNPEETIENVSIASFDNGGDGVPVKELIVGIEPVQASGTPTPDSPLAITGYTDVNAMVTGKNIANFIDGKNIDPNGTISSGATRSATVDGIPIRPNVQYKAVSVNNSATFIYAVWSNGSLVRRLASTPSGTVLDTSNGDTLYVCGYSSGTVTAAGNQLMVVVDDTDTTTYEAYNGTTDTISLGQTVYGGELNVTTGEKTVNRGHLDLGTCTFTKLALDSYTIFHTTISGKASNTNDICSAFKNSEAVRYNIGDNEFGYFNLSNSINIVCFRDDSKANLSAADFKTAMSGVDFVYELATPTTTTLTPTEVATVLGYNNIYADTGDVVSVTYIKDTASAIYPIVSTTIGDLTTLTTTDKSSVVNAINELDSELTTAFKVVEFGAGTSFTVPGAGSLDVTANDLGVTTPTGYTPIAVAGWYCAGDDVVPQSLVLTATGSSTFCVLKTVNYAAYTGEFRVSVLYVKTSLV